MELIHANSSLVEQRIIDRFIQWDVRPSLANDPKKNDFQLDLDESDWSAHPINRLDYVYEPGTEYGGRVYKIVHTTNGKIQVSGRTWRGMLIDKAVSPPSGSAYKTIASAEANAAIDDLIGSALSPVFEASTADSGITVSGSFRYQTLLYCLEKMLGDSDARLKIELDEDVVVLSAVEIADLSGEAEFSQDVVAPLQTALDDSMAYNHVIALGSGELTARTVVELYRQSDGTINSTPLPAGVTDRQIVLDYPNAESTDELTAKATELLETTYWPIESVEIDVADDQALALGDLVGGRDYVTGLAVKAQVTEIIRTVNTEGEKTKYKVSV